MYQNWLKEMDGMGSCSCESQTAFTSTKEDNVSSMITNNTITMRRIRIRRNKGGGRTWPSYSSAILFTVLCLSVGSSMAVMTYQSDLSSTSNSNSRHGCFWSRTNASSVQNQGSNKESVYHERNNMKTFPSLSSSSAVLPHYYSSSMLASSSQLPVSNFGDGGLTLNCNLRTMNTTTQFTREQVEQAKVAVVKCSDKIFFESVLSPNQTIFQLRNLRELEISACKIRRIPKAAFSSMRQLRKLNIHTENVQWSSSVGLEIESGAWEGLTQLESLNLHMSNMWTFFPDRNVLCPMRNLKQLNVSFNRLTDVDEFGGVSGDGNSECVINVQNLDLSSNYLRRLTKSSFSRFRRLTDLNLSFNILEEIEDSSLAGLPLQRLNLASNRLVALPPSIFSSVGTLTELFLSNNSIIALSPKVFSGLELLLLDLSRNGLTSQESIFGGLTRLVFLKLSFNKLKSIDSEMFSDLISLQSLSLNNNEIQVIHPDAFKSLTNLHSLDLRFNQLTFVNGQLLSNLFVLRQLFLDGNQISSVDSQLLKNCSGSLQDFSISNNNLQQIDFIREASLGQLKTLDIGENKISNLNNQSFSGLTQLYGLRMVDNRLTEITSGFCEYMKNLRVLNVGQNRIRTILPRAFTGCPELRALRLDSNLLEELPPTLSPQLPSLLWFNVSQNQLKSVRMDLIPEKVEWLDLSYNKLVSLVKPEKAPFNVRVLDVSYNFLTSLDQSTIPFDKLEIVRLNFNNIRSVAPDTFSQAAQLRRVELISNKIERLDLSSIRFPQIPQGRSLPEMYLGDNQFMCTCEMEWLTRVSQLATLRQYPRIVDLDAITCRLTFTPSSTALVAQNQPAVRLSMLSSKDFLCPYEDHCFHLCPCCEFLCDCFQSCPESCECYHDTAWSVNIVQCSNSNFSSVPVKIPMDATEIFLDGNQMTILSSHTFIGKKYLKNLFLNNSQIEIIKNKTFNGLKASLEVLHLESNLLQEIQGYEFADLDNLKELYLQNNYIRFINQNAFNSLKLKVLRLDGNLLVDFNVWELTKANPYLNSIMLSGNPWNCDCEFLIPFKRWVSSLKNTIIVDFALAKCQPTVDEQQENNNSSVINPGGSTITSQTSISQLCSFGGGSVASLATDGGNASNQGIMNNHISNMGGATRSNLLSGPYQHGHLETHPHSAGNYQPGFPQNEIATTGGGGGRRFNAGQTSGDDEDSGNSTFFTLLITFIAAIIVASLAFMTVLVVIRRRGGHSALSSKWLRCFTKCGINDSSSLPKCLSAPGNSSSPNECGGVGGGGVGGSTTSPDLDHYYYEQEKLFDAYFIYSQKDEEFVTEKLTGELERGAQVITQQHYYPPGTKKLRLCLHYRDLCLAPDNPWSAEMILSATDASKRVVLVISNNFLNGEWTNNHFRSSVLSAIQQHYRKLIVIKVGPVSDSSVNSVCSLIESAVEQQQRQQGTNSAPKQITCTPSTTRLEWGDSNFWPKFRILLPSPQVPSTGNNNSNNSISSYGRTSQLLYTTNLNPNGLNLNNRTLLPYQIPLLPGHQHYQQDPSALQQQHFITLMNWTGQHQQQGIPSLPLGHSSSVHPVPSHLTPQQFGYSNVDGFPNNINNQQTVMFSQQQPLHFSSSNNIRQQGRDRHPHNPDHLHHIHTLSHLSNMYHTGKNELEGNYSSSAVSSGNEDHVYSTLDSPLESPCSDLGPGHVQGQFEGAVISGARVNRHHIQNSTSSGISSGSDATSGTGGCHPNGGGGGNPGGPPMYFV